MEKSISKILFVITSMGAGGAEKVCVTLANHLSKNTNYKISIVYFYDDSKLVDEINDSVEIFHLNSSKLILGLPKLYSHVKEKNPHFIFANIWPVTIISIICNILNFKNRAHLMTIEHSFLKEDFKDKSFLFKALANLSIRIFYRFAKSNVAVSSVCKKDLQHRSKTAVSIINNPIEKPSKNFPLDKNFQHWYKSNDLKLISVGTLKKQKDYYLQIEACNELKKMGVKFQHLIIGEGEEKNKIKEKIDSYELNESIMLAGYQKHPQIYLDHGDIFLLTSDYEAFGNVIVEALYSGIKIIARNDNSGAGDILKNGEFGKLFYGKNPKTLAKLILSTSLDSISKEKLMMRAEEFSPQKIVKKYQSLLDL